ncbi:50S ribosomal protein L18 [Buchnera aphidicola (Chaitoregma tattakana)]|uniref:50S ribosomal protein L18 n=1 Tax=Buchnera aphidicola TaxID=9 RepID=UPI0031B89B73
MSVFKKKLARMRRYSKSRNNFKRLQSIRLVVHRTSRNMYAQVISVDNFVIVSASTLEKNIRSKLLYTGNKVSSTLVGKEIAIRALKKGIKNVSFDRSGFKYHGRIKELADSARKHGLRF